MNNKLRIAVLCFAHKDVPLLNKLIKQFLSLPAETDIYIHLDKKSMNMKCQIEKSEHVKFIKNNVSVTWGDDTMMKAMFASLEEIKNSNLTYDSFIICTGQDMLVREGLVEFLKDNPDKIFLDAKKEKEEYFRNVLSHKYPRALCRDLTQFKWYHPKRLWLSIHYRLMIHGLLPKKRNIVDVNSLNFYYSYNWSVMPFKVFEYIVNYLDTTPQFKNMYFNTVLPEDSFLATVIMNSPFSKNVQWLNDYESKTLTYHTPIVVHPKNFTMDDVFDINNSGCYFARKFDSKVSTEVIDYYYNLITK